MRTLADIDHRNGVTEMTSHTLTIGELINARRGEIASARAEIAYMQRRLHRPHANLTTVERCTRNIRAEQENIADAMRQIVALRAMAQLSAN